MHEWQNLLVAIPTISANHLEEELNWTICTIWLWDKLIHCFHTCQAQLHKVQSHVALFVLHFIFCFVKALRWWGVTRSTQPHVLSVPALFWILRGQIHHFILSMCARASARGQICETKMVYLSQGLSNRAGARVTSWKVVWVDSTSGGYNLSSIIFL
jgi:hypothetical protein